MSTPRAYEPAQRPYLDASRNAWIVSRYDDVLKTLRAPNVVTLAEGIGIVSRVSRRTNGSFEDLAAILGGLLIFQNEPEHTPSRAFAFDMVRAMSSKFGPESMDRFVEALLDGLAGGRDIDVMPRLCFALSDGVFAETFGYAPDVMRKVRESGHGLIEDWRPAMALREYEARQVVAAELRETLEAQWRNSACPMHSGEAELPRDKRDGALLNLFVLANDTMAGFLGNVLELLTRAPDLQEILRREPERMTVFVEEALRLAGPIRYRSRFVKGEDLDLDGVAVPDGALIHVMIESAGRDPDAYEEPEAFRFDRKGPPSLAFAAGPHLCAGAVFARTLAKRFLTKLLTRFRLHPADAPARYVPNPELRQFESLTLKLELI
jgi:cytochrome P450